MERVDRNHSRLYLDASYEEESKRSVTSIASVAKRRSALSVNVTTEGPRFSGFTLEQRTEGVKWSTSARRSGAVRRYASVDERSERPELKSEVNVRSLRDGSGATEIVGVTRHCRVHVSVAISSE